MYRVNARSHTPRVPYPRRASAARAGPLVGRRATPALWGALLNDGSHAALEYAQGLRVAELDYGWDNYETADGVFSNVLTAGSDAYTLKQRVQTMRAAGLKVALSPGLQYPPAWALAFSNAQYINQFGSTGGDINLVFNNVLRGRAAAYLARLHQDLNLNIFWAIRVGSGGESEVLFPDEAADGVHGNGYWAYDSNATGVGGNLPPTIAPNPRPTWAPGTADTVANHTAWITWYIGALADCVNWQIATLRGLGYTGIIHVVMPGFGTRYDEVQGSIATNFDGTWDPNGTLGRGAVWQQIMPLISPRYNVLIDISSVDDSSSYVSGGVNNMPTSTDFATNMHDGFLDYWSSTRYLRYVANYFGFKIVGENPANNPHGKQMIADVGTLVQACGITALFWAFDTKLYSGVDGYTLGDLAAAAARYT